MQKMQRGTKRLFIHPNGSRGPDPPPNEPSGGDLRHEDASALAAAKNKTPRANMIAVQDLHCCSAQLSSHRLFKRPSPVAAMHQSIAAPERTALTPAYGSAWFEAMGKNRVFWILQLGGWGGVVTVAMWTLSPDTLLLMPFVLVRGLLGLAITSFLLRPLFQKLRERLHVTLEWWLPGAVVLALAVGFADSKLVHWFAFNWFGPNHPSVGLHRLLESGGSIRFVTYGSWIVLYLMINELLAASGARRRRERLKSEMIESELRLLRAKADPHFLFNTLATIFAESRQPERVAELTQSLAGFLRFSLSQSTALQPLGDELAALEDYLRVEKIRFEEQLEYTLVADAAARCQRVPSALVQPLLESAIKFGQRTDLRPLRIAIHAQVLQEELRVEVSSIGKWMELGHGESTGTDLANLRRRLQVLCGDEAWVWHEVMDDRVVFQVVVPAMRRQSLPVTARLDECAG